MSSVNVKKVIIYLDVQHKIVFKTDISAFVITLEPEGPWSKSSK